jgi:hypothetical protein
MSHNPNEERKSHHYSDFGNEKISDGERERERERDESCT